MKHPTLTIDLDAIKYNYKHLKCFYKKNVIAVLKDDAYSCGLLKVASVLEDQEGLIVALTSIYDAIKLRKNNFTKPILYLNIFDENDVKLILKYDITVSVSSLSQLMIAKAHKIKFHLKINTGMNRIGMNRKDALIAIGKINSHLKEYNFCGIYTHFANEDKEHTSYLRFIDIVKEIADKSNIAIHCFSSSSLRNDENISNYIRVGIKLYGIGERSPFLHNAITLTSPIIQILPIKSGEMVGYDYQYEVKENGYLYLLPIGYGQGWGKFDNSFAYCNFKYLYQAGLISMDYSCYYSTQLFSINDTVELLGCSIPLESIAKINKVDPHEILVDLRVEKKYYKKHLLIK